jgi:N6-adenosine-specific RNA methylase IME4
MEARSMTEWPFGELQMFGFDVIMADPPWSFENWAESGNGKNPNAHYECMPTADICRLPVGHLAGRDCWLWLWATYPMLRDAMQVMDAWGFRYVTGGPWVKRGSSGKLAFGTGYVLRSCSEIFLIGKTGEPATFAKDVRNVIESPRRQHSRKPDEAYRAAEKLFGPARRADLFSRQERRGWQAWGRESAMFEPEVA